MADRHESEESPQSETTTPANRAERRASRGSQQPLPRSTGKVRPVRFDHATDPRQFAAHRRG
jgi:hypothetical protein